MKRTMAKQEFFQSVRTAVSFLAPRVDGDTPLRDRNELEGALRRAVIWLTPKSIQGFDPGDFADLPSEQQDELAASVDEFISVAKSVPANEPANSDQINAALPPFLNIVKAVQKIVRDEWLDAARRLLEQAENWAMARQWPTRCFPKAISEDFIGTYTLRKLVFGVEGSQLVLNPLGRFAPGADGIFDFAVLPVYESAMVVRQQGKWYIHPPSHEHRRREWSEVAFVETAQKLTRLA